MLHERNKLLSLSLTHTHTHTQSVPWLIPVTSIFPSRRWRTVHERSNMQALAMIINLSTEFCLQRVHHTSFPQAPCTCGFTTGELLGDSSSKKARCTCKTHNMSRLPWTLDTCCPSVVVTPAKEYSVTRKGILNIYIYMFCHPQRNIE